MGAPATIRIVAVRRTSVGGLTPDAYLARCGITLLPRRRKLDYCSAPIAIIRAAYGHGYCFLSFQARGRVEAPG